MSTQSDFKAALEFLSPKVTKHLKAVEREDLPTKTLYHVSTDPNIPVFIPQVSARTVTDEDVRVPRICVAANLTSCLVGYGAMWRDYYDEKVKKGWTIYEFDFELAVRPSAELLPDQKQTDEYWLISYGKETREYKPKVIGTLTMVGYSSARIKSRWDYQMGFVIDTNKPVWISDSIELPAGKHFFMVRGWSSQVDLGKLEFEHQEVDDKMYDKLISGKVNLLPQLKPGSAQW